MKDDGTFGLTMWMCQTATATKDYVETDKVAVWMDDKSSDPTIEYWDLTDSKFSYYRGTWKTLDYSAEAMKR